MRFLAAILAVFVLVGGIGYGLMRLTEEKEKLPDRITVIAEPEVGPLTGAVEDDSFDTKVKRSLLFDEELIRPSEFKDQSVNISEAVVGLDLGLVDPNAEPIFAKAFPTPKAAADAADELEQGRQSLIPTAAMVFHKARQFDSSYLATLDSSLIYGRNDKKVGMIRLVQELFGKLENTDYARTYLSAALELVDRKTDIFPEEVNRRNIWLTRYRNQIREIYPPIDFYSWSPELEKVYDFETFLQDTIPKRQWFMAAQLARTLTKPENAELLEHYRFILNAFDMLYVPRRMFTIDDLTRITLLGDSSIMEMFRNRPGMIYNIAFLPPAWRREQVHFIEMMPMGVFPGLNPFGELTQRSMIGYVSFIPPSRRPGVEQYHALALDSLIAEQKSLEADKILLTRAYRERLFNPYFAVERRVYETDQVRQPTPWKPTDPDKLSPALRIEPVPVFYARTARAYQYMQGIAMSILGEKTYKEIHRVLPGGKESPETLANELEQMKRLWFGLYIICCEDIGIRPTFDSGDTIDQNQCYEEALDWLEHIWDDPAMAADSRYMSPVIFIRPSEQNNRDQIVTTWGNYGFRLTRLDARYARPPQLKPKTEGGIWSTASDATLGIAHYLAPQVQFKTFELLSRGGLHPQEFRKMSDQVDLDPDKLASALMALDPPLAKQTSEEVTPQEVEESGQKQGVPQVKETP